MVYRPTSAATEATSPPPGKTLTHITIFIIKPNKTHFSPIFSYMSFLCIYLVIFGAKINAEWSLIVAKVHKKWGIIEQKFDFECNFINESKMKPSLLSSATLSAFLPTMPPKTKTRSRLRNRIKPARGQAQKEVAVGQDSLRGKITKETRKL